MTERMLVQICSDGLMAACRVCEPNLENNADTQRTWIMVPTTTELLHICLWCGNTHRQKRLE